MCCDVDAGAVVPSNDRDEAIIHYQSTTVTTRSSFDAVIIIQLLKHHPKLLPFTADVVIHPLDVRPSIRLSIDDRC